MFETINNLIRIRFAITWDDGNVSSFKNRFGVVLWILGNMSTLLMSVAELSNIFSVLAVLLCFCVMILFITRWVTKINVKNYFLKSHFQTIRYPLHVVAYIFTLFFLCISEIWWYCECMEMNLFFHPHYIKLLQGYPKWIWWRSIFPLLLDYWRLQSLHIQVSATIFSQLCCLQQKLPKSFSKSINSLGRNILIYFQSTKPY